MPKPRHPPRSQSRAGRKEEISVATGANDLVRGIHARTTRHEAEELALKRKLIPRLAKRAYHLEDDNSWLQDWAQYQKNTHPVFGLCLHHRFHPVRLPQRVIILIGSCAFGFAVTNCVYMGFLEHDIAGDAVNTLYNATGELAKFQQEYTSIEVEQSMVFLLTVGGFIHSVFDMSIWYLMACFCFRPGGMCQGEGEGGTCRKGFQNFGIYAAVLAVMTAVAAATFVAVMRLNQDEQIEAVTRAEQFAEVHLDGNDEDAAASTNRFTFLVGYALEMVFALFVFYFITSTVFFSGILGCGRLPVLGGRPYEIRKRGSSSNDNEDENEEKEEGDTLGLVAMSYSF